MDWAKAFLSGLDKKALRCVSHETAVDGRSLEVRLLAMTRRANAEQFAHMALQDEYYIEEHGQRALQMELQRMSARNEDLVRALVARGH